IGSSKYFVRGFPNIFLTRTYPDNQSLSMHRFRTRAVDAAPYVRQTHTEIREANPLPRDHLSGGPTSKECQLGRKPVSTTRSDRRLSCRPNRIAPPFRSGFATPISTGKGTVRTRTP